MSNGVTSYITFNTRRIATIFSRSNLTPNLNYTITSEFLQVEPIIEVSIFVCLLTILI